MIATIAARELRSLFLSPLAFAILAVVQFIMAWVFLILLEYYLDVQGQLSLLANAPGVTELVVAQLYENPVLLLILLAIVPLLTMRLISEERRASTLPLLFSAPVSMTEIILGKFLGVMGFLTLLLAMLMLMPLSLLLAGSLDVGAVAAVLLGLWLMLGAFAAAGLYMSTLTRHPAVAAVASFGLLLLLLIIDSAGAGKSGVFTYLSLQHHFHAMRLGIIDTSDVVYYLLFITVFLVFSIRRLDADRLQH